VLRKNSTKAERRSTATKSREKRKKDHGGGDLATGNPLEKEGLVSRDLAYGGTNLTYQKDKLKVQYSTILEPPAAKVAPVKSVLRCNLSTTEQQLFGTNETSAFLTRGKERKGAQTRGSLLTEETRRSNAIPLP